MAHLSSFQSLSYLFAAVGSTADNTAYQTGYIFGSVIGVVIVLGILVFAMVAVFKACTQQTPGWIVAGCIGGIILAVPVIGLLFGFSRGFMIARQKALERVAALKNEPSSSAATPHASTAPQIVRGADLPYSLSLPPDWTSKLHESYFDIFASRKSLYIGVVAEEASVGDAATISSLARERLKKNVTELVCSEPAPLVIDNHSWLQFKASGKVKNIPLTYQFYVYSGQEGTFQIVGWTTSNLFDRDVSLLSDVMKTFRFLPAAAATTPEPRTQ